MVRGNTGAGNDFVELHRVGAVCIAGNSGSPADYVYADNDPHTDRPAFDAADGSTARRRTGGGPGTTMYVREAGEWGVKTDRSCEASREAPTFPATEQIASHCEPYSPVLTCSNTNATARSRRPEGQLDVGRPADLVLLQSPNGGSASDPLAAIERGDIPSVVGVVVDGCVRALRSRNTPAPSRLAQVVGDPTPLPGGDR